jgi:ribosomal-protein-alanine N-acetyltransferase
MLTINLSGFHELETERLKLRRVDLNDVNELFAMRSDPQIMKYIPRPLATTHEEILDFIKAIDEKINANEIFNWAITLTGHSQWIGTIGYYHIKPEHYRAEIGYMLLPDFQGKGYVTEAINMIINYGFTKIGLHSIEALIDPENLAKISEEDINFFMVDIIAYFNDVGLDIDIRQLTKLFVLDKKLYEFANSMSAGKGDYSYILTELTAEKKDKLSAALKIAKAYWSDTIDH